MEKKEWSEARKQKAKVLTAEEETRVYAAAKTDGHGERRYAKRDTCILDFSFGLGLRAKEIAALMIDDVTDSKGNIVESFNLSADQVKGDTIGAVYLTEKQLRKNLEAYLAERGEDSNRHLFKSQKTHFSGNTLQMLLGRIYKAAGIEGAKSHTGRRTFATRLIEQGYNITAVSKLMRHKSIQTTSGYVDNNPVALGRMVANVRKKS